MSSFSPEQVEALKAAGVLSEDATGGGEAAPVESVESAPEAAAEPAEVATSEPVEKDEPLGEAGLKALRAEREARAKFEAEAKAASGLKGQLTKTANQLDEVSKERAALASELTRYKVALTHGLSAEDIDLLPAGVDEEQLERLAVRLSNTSSKRPAPDVNQGRTGAAPDDPKAAFRALLETM